MLREKLDFYYVEFLICDGSAFSCKVNMLRIVNKIFNKGIRILKFFKWL